MMAGLISIQHDHLFIEVELDNDTTTNPFIFALIPSKKEKIYRKERYDIVRITTHRLPILF
jgi:hypothetical protein